MYYYSITLSWILLFLYYNNKYFSIKSLSKICSALALYSKLFHQFII